MSVITIVQRALPFSLYWKRRHSASKEKEANPGSPDLAIHEDELFGNQSTDSSGTTLHHDVSDAVHIAVKQPVNDTTKPDASSPESDLDSDSKHETHRLSDSSQACAREQLCRAVSWASIVRSQSRWTKEQERQLWMAEKQLRKCQKAWSSEQEIWLAYIQSLNEEKEAHEDFMLMRMKQQEEERNQFRKAWKRRRSVESALEDKEHISLVTVRRNSSGLTKFRRLPLYESPVPHLATAKSTTVACRA